MSLMIAYSFLLPQALHFIIELVVKLYILFANFLASFQTGNSSKDFIIAK